MDESPDQINKRYRLSEIKRWQSVAFVLGYEIRLSHNPSKECQMCRDLAGKYPKTFIWTGWHMKCKCHSFPVLMNPDEFNTDELGELRAALNGIDYNPRPSLNMIHHLPVNFLSWYARNVIPMNDSNEYPDFVKDNIELICYSFDYYTKTK